jgi:hypothetical protein
MYWKKMIKMQFRCLDLRMRRWRRLRRTRRRSGGNKQPRRSYREGRTEIRRRRAK